MLRRRVVCHDCLSTRNELGGGEQRQRPRSIDDTFSWKLASDFSGSFAIGVGPDDGNSKFIRKPLRQLYVIRPAFGAPCTAGGECHNWLRCSVRSSKQAIDGIAIGIRWIETRPDLIRCRRIRAVGHRQRPQALRMVMVRAILDL